MRVTPELETASGLDSHPWQPPAVAPAACNGGDTVPPWAALLHHFYRRQRLPFPRLTRVPPDALPRPFRRLLAHCNDMTPTLEAFHGEAVSLRVCDRQTVADSYAREVVLELATAGHPVAYGAIRIHLDRLEPPARRSILEEREPFGAILQAEAVPHLCWPQAFFHVEADARMSRLLKLSHPGALYGRRNVVLDVQRQLLAEVIEVLAPAPRSSG